MWRRALDPAAGDAAQRHVAAPSERLHRPRHLDGVQGPAARGTAGPTSAAQPPLTHSQ